MNPLWPAVLVAAAVAVASGLPLPARAVLAGGVRRRRTIPRAALPVLAGVTAVVVAGLVAGLLVAGSILLGERAWQRRREQVALAAERAAAIEAMTALAAELRAGRVPAEAFAAAAEVALGPTSSALQSSAAAIRWGAGPEESLQRHAPSTAVPEMLLSLAACWQVCSGTGSSLATAVDRLEEGLRKAARQRDLVAAEVAQARASAVAMACLPAVGLLLGAGMGGNPLHFLLHTPLGVLCLSLGLGLDLLGLWWSRRLVARALGGAR